MKKELIENAAAGTGSHGSLSYAKRLSVRAMADILAMDSDERRLSMRKLHAVLALPTPHREQAFVKMIVQDIKDKDLRRRRVSFAA